MTAIQQPQQKRAELIEEMKKRFVSREEIAQFLHCKDSAARSFVGSIKDEYPVISSKDIRGYKIACTDEDVTLARKARLENHHKAGTLHARANIIDKWIIRQEIAIAKVNNPELFNN